RWLRGCVCIAAVNQLAISEMLLVGALAEATKPNQTSTSRFLWPDCARLAHPAEPQSLTVMQRRAHATCPLSRVPQRLDRYPTLTLQGHLRVQATARAFQT